MNTRTVSLLFGVTFIAAGLLGFIPNPLVAPDGVFAVNGVHNFVHILTGIAILTAVLKYPGYEGRILKIVGTAYAVVTVVGFLTSGNTMLGIIHINQADRWLHLGLAIVILGAGFLPADKKPRFTANVASTH